MKVTSNMPDTEDAIRELEDRVANFHATLVIESIKQLNVKDKFKQELLNSILEHLKNSCTKD